MIAYNNEILNSYYYTIPELLIKKALMSKSDWLDWLDSLTCFEVSYIRGILNNDEEVNAIFMKKLRNGF